MVEPGHRYNFVIDEKFVEQAILKLPPATEIVVDIRNEQRVGDAFENDYICLVCTNVVWKPKSCAKCEKMFCTKCLDDWLARNQTCPNCRKNFKNGKVPRVA